MRTAKEFSADPTYAVRFWAGVDRTGGCWVWTKYKNAKGYGVFAVGAGRTELAHRIASALVHGPITARELVLHSRECTSRACCRPSHLYRGDQKQNMADVKALGRQSNIGAMMRERGIRDSAGRFVGIRSAQ